MLTHRVRTRGRGLAVFAGIGMAALTGCRSEPLFSSPAEAVGFSRAYGIWAPGSSDTCTREIHDRHSVIGPDGWLYPTWHPPVDPATGCQFGHEHGRDPRGSNIFREVGPIPFGYANQQLDIYDPFTSRHEDHVGHKVEWENDVRLNFNGAAAAVLEIRCDVLTKLHQGTHSKDAFSNNVHELVYHIRCNDGTAMSVTMLATIGKPGEFVSACDRQRTIKVGPATPVNSPEGGGKRAIPDRACIDRHLLVQPGQTSNFSSGLRESWETSNSLRTETGHTLARFDPYFQVLFPSRFFDASQPSGVGRPIDLCYPSANGTRADGEPCRQSTGNGALAGVRFDDPRSRFDGVLRFVDINSNRIANADGPEFWFTDPWGRNGRTSPFPGSIRQYVAGIDNSGRAGHGPAIGRQRNHGGPGVHAPN